MHLAQQLEGHHGHIRVERALPAVVAEEFFSVFQYVDAAMINVELLVAEAFVTSGSGLAGAVRPMMG